MFVSFSRACNSPPTPKTKSPPVSLLSVHALTSYTQSETDGRAQTQRSWDYSCWGSRSLIRSRSEDVSCSALAGAQNMANALCSWIASFFCWGEFVPFTGFYCFQRPTCLLLQPDWYIKFLKLSEAWAWNEARPLTLINCKCPAYASSFLKLRLKKTIKVSLLKTVIFTNY